MNPPSTSQATTPLRTLEHGMRDGCRLLSDQPVDYADGVEQEVFDLIGRCEDVSSMSDELERAASSTMQRYHVARARANVMRSLDIPPDARILEIGVGCGAVTRFIGESCDLLDAIEPMHARARAARARTRDLPGVEVYVGGIEDVPDEAAYDMVVFSGVLEWMCGGTDAHAPYVAILDKARRVLRSGGVVVCAIENQLGVKYLAGAREDHTARRYDGVEGYPLGTPAWTFGRRELEELFREAGLEPRTLHLFPDYKATRVAFSDDLLDRVTSRGLASELPEFPSLDWWSASGVGTTHANEHGLWNTLVRAGLGKYTANSLLVVASESAEGNSGRLWPSERVARYFNVGNRAAHLTRVSDVLMDGDEVRFARRPLTESRDVTGPIELRTEHEPLVDGASMIDLLAGADRERGDRLLISWVSRLRLVLAEDGPVPIDFLPHNLLVTDAEELVAIDQEWWWHEPVGVGAIVTLGVVTAARRLAARGTHPMKTIGEAARDLAARAGVVLSDTEFEQGLDFVARVFAAVHDGTAPSDATIVLYRTSLNEIIESSGATASESGSADAEELGRMQAYSAEVVREHDQVRDWALKLERSVEEHIAARRQLDDAVARLEQENSELRAELATKSRRPWRR